MLIVRSGTRFSGLAALGLALLAGCGPATPAAPDPGEAALVLEKTLAAWQAGGAVDGQKDAAPPVVVSDPEWAGGARLARFEIEGQPAPSGAQQKFRVNLWLDDGKGGARERKVHYEVGTQPIHTVFRTVFE